MDTGALQLMFQNGMNGMGAMQLGANNAISQQADQAKLKAMQMENEQNSVMNPLNAQFMQGRINQQQAELPGIVGQSQSSQAKGQFDTSSLASNIEAAVAKNGAAVGEAGMQKMHQDAEKMGQVAAVLKGFDSSTHATLLPKIMQQYGLSTNSPIIQQLLAAPDPSMIAPALTTISDGMAKGSQAYIANSGQQAQAQSNKVDLNNADIASHEKIATGNNATSIEVARITAESRKAVADAKAKSLAQNMGIDKAIAHIEMMGNSASDEDKETLRRLQEYKLTEKAAGAPAVAQTVLDQKTPVQVAKDATPAKRIDLNNMTEAERTKVMAEAKAKFDLQPGSKPGTSVAPADAGMAELAKKTGQAYEPAKYEYKVVNGVLHRRPK